VTKKVKNVAASVHARLLQKAKAEGRSFNELLPYYGMERFLYRLSRTPHGKRFVLKGALALEALGGKSPRATKDIDLLGRRSASTAELVSMVRECMALEVEDDGIRFDPRSVAGEPIRLATQYGGVRLTFRGALGNTRLALQVDVGFGDVITPGPLELTYPTLLGTESPRLLGYPLETMIAEKLHAMVVLDMANSRMKDFLDFVDDCGGSRAVRKSRRSGRGRHLQASCDPHTRLAAHRSHRGFLRESHQANTMGRFSPKVARVVRTVGAGGDRTATARVLSPPSGCSLWQQVLSSRVAPGRPMVLEAVVPKQP
jgi:hypothetical protein